ncbi:cell division protein FtsB [Thermomonas sp.]|uniref:cell division protein FtsB n=1 Tax=Thermomonas sp. TaxID=1971895 RepID=UPI0024879742|nr:cell division protein FtsB [Thermomonas sp.]MDI1253908.1 cell division protein FtsB [Thermomonas sp.]
MKATALLVLLLAALLAWLQYTMWFGTGGSHEVDALRAQVEHQRTENLQLQQRNEALVAEVGDLKSGGAAVEERARSELGMVKPGETFYRVVDGSPQSSAPVAPVAPPAPETGR